MWILAIVGAFVLGLSVLGYRQVMATTQVDAALRLEPWTGDAPRSVDLEKAIRALEALGFTAPTELASRNAGTAINQQSIARIAVGVDPAGTTWGIAYELSTLVPGQGDVPDVGAQVTTVDLVSRLESGRTITTSNAKLGFFDKNPQNVELKLPLVGSIAELMTIHAAELAREAQTSPAKDLRRLDFEAEFSHAWLEAFEFQASRGLFVREGPVFKAKPKLALRGVLNHWMPLREPQGWRWLLHLGWTGLVVAGLGAVAHRAPLGESEAAIAAAGLGAIAGALGAAVFFPTSVIFTVALGVLGSLASGYEGLLYSLAAIFSFITVDRRRGQRRAQAAKRTLDGASAEAPP